MPVTDELLRCARYLQQNIIYFVLERFYLRLRVHGRNTAIIYEAVRHSENRSRRALQRNSICASVCAETLIAIYEWHVLLSRISSGEPASLKKASEPLLKDYTACYAET